MVVVTEAELEEMRAVFLDALTSTGKVYRTTLASDSTGGGTETETMVSTLACRCETAQHRSGLSEVGQVVASRIDNRDLYIIYFPSGADVRADDRVEIGSRSFRMMSVIYGDFHISRRAFAVEEV